VLERRRYRASSSSPGGSVGSVVVVVVDVVDVVVEVVDVVEEVEVVDVVDVLVVDVVVVVSPGPAVEVEVVEVVELVGGGAPARERWGAVADRRRVAPVGAEPLVGGGVVAGTRSLRTLVVVTRSTAAVPRPMVPKATAAATTRAPEGNHPLRRSARRLRPTTTARGRETASHSPAAVTRRTAGSAAFVQLSTTLGGTLRFGVELLTRKDDGVSRVTAAMVAAGRSVAEPRLAPDGERLAFVTSEDGRSRLVVVDAAGGPEVVVTTEPAPASARGLGGGVFDWTPDGAALVYVARVGGLWLQPVAGGPPRLVTPGDGITGPAVAPDGRSVVFEVDHHHIDLVALDGTGRRRLSGGADFALDPVWSPDGEHVAWQEWDVPAMAWDSSRIVVDGRVVAGGAGVQVQQPRFSPYGRQLAFLSDARGWLNLTVLDLGTGAPTVLAEPYEHGGPTWGTGQRSFAWSPDGTELVVTRNERGFGALVRWTPGAEPEPMAKAVHGGLSWRGERLAAVRSGARTPTQIVVYEGGDRRTIAIGPPAVGEAPLPEPELVEWPADDGAVIPGRLYRTGGPPGRLLCWVHGGPTDQWPVEWRPRFSYWLDRGWSILVPDHRGSTGHGRAFAQALAGRWGELDVADVAAGLQAAGPAGWGDPARLVAMGASAGGFTVLNLLAHHPGLCAAGVVLYGVADLLALAQVDYRYEAHYTHSLVGPLPDEEARYRERSPVRRAEQLTDPVLLLHGRDDEVVPVAQAEALAARLQQLGRPVELHVYDGEGHGWGRAATVTDELARTTAFLDQHVGHG
jgi:dipeptidyl aminopeptidase/acylaminoacyl peptidase